MTTKLHNYQTVTQKEAERRGYKALTYTFLPTEYPLLDKAIAGLKNPAHPIPHLLVHELDNDNEISVWRK